MIKDIGVIIVYIGSLFILIASVGFLRMPDLLTRMHASTKGVTFGIGLIFIGVAVYFSTLADTTRVIIGLIFLSLTAPVGSHAIARAAYFLDVKLWKGTIQDEFREAGRQDSK